MAAPSRRAFTLIELLVVIAVIAILAAILFPVFARARAASQTSSCAASLRQLAAAMLQYAEDWQGRFVPAAPDIMDPGGGLRRWHGVRKSIDKPFDPAAGPLWNYLGRSSQLKACPAFRPAEGAANSFESGCGGYGYNTAYIGGGAAVYSYGDTRWATHTARLSEVRDPAGTIMLADCGIAQTAQNAVHEYSFAEPVWFVTPDGPLPYHPTPSIHFRHNGRANVAWCDGHVTSERMGFTTGDNPYGADNAAARTGWFGPKDNSLFDLL